MNVIDHDLNVAEASSVPRIHHQWFPDVLGYERGISPDTLQLLRAMGHKVEPRTNVGATQSIMCRDGFIFGASDPRRIDALTLGY
jgi:gamma-glutamyltranspeptidase/glutathione hydrolase